MILSAVSIKEPWASMIARGEKTIELRTWRTKHRGKIVLCASKKPEGGCAGNAFAIADIADVRPMREADREKSGVDFCEGLYSWILKNIELIEPFPVSGKPGLYKVTMPIPSIKERC